MGSRRELSSRFEPFVEYRFEVGTRCVYGRRVSGRAAAYDKAFYNFVFHIVSFVSLSSQSSVEYCSYLTGFVVQVSLSANDYILQR